jgi:hypothetical protein
MKWGSGFWMNSGWGDELFECLNGVVGVDCLDYVEFGRVVAASPINHHQKTLIDVLERVFLHPSV